jgi:hypothetical protein
LQSATGELARITFPSAWKDVAEVEFGSQAWTIDRQGFFQAASFDFARWGSKPFAVYHQDAVRRGGQLELPEGRRFKFSRNLWLTRLDFLVRTVNYWAH